MNSTANVIVEIEDINDNNPEFERESYTADVSETAPSGNCCAYWRPRIVNLRKIGEIPYTAHGAKITPTLIFF